jgi:hypothetical protein
MDKEEKPKVYIGTREYKFGRMIMSHMASPDINALHDMATAIGIQRKFFQDSNAFHPHYDVCKANKQLAMTLGAIEISDKEMIKICFKNKKQQ